jgi:hypothetical protein
MGERKLSVEELLERIDELLNVLNMISRDLAEVAKALKAMGGSATATPPSPPERMGTIEDVRGQFPPDLEDMLEFEETEEYVKISPRRYLGTENFAKIASIVRDAGGEYVSAGRESHFRLPKRMP